MIATILEPLRDAIPDEELRRIEAALCLVAGGEAIQVLRDVCHLEADAALAVTQWAANAILTAGLRQRHARTHDPTSRAKHDRPI